MTQEYWQDSDIIQIMNKMLFSFAFFPFSPSTLAPLRVNHGCKAPICVSHLIKLLHAKQWEMWQDEAKRDFVVIFHLKEDLFKRKWCRIRKMTIATQIVDGHVYIYQFVQRCRLALHIVSKKWNFLGSIDHCPGDLLRYF